MTHPDATTISESNRARMLAQFAHFYQRDKSDLAYFEYHVRQVAERVIVRGHEAGLSTEETLLAETVAYLHDVAEDYRETGVSMDMIVAWGFSDEVIEILGLVTKRKGQSREDYIAGVCTNRIAKVVKAADLDSNTTPSRVRRLDLPTQVRLLTKYIRDFAQMEMEPRWLLERSLAEATRKMDEVPA